MVTDAGSNYYIGGQAWFLKINKLKYLPQPMRNGFVHTIICRRCNSKKISYILSVTGDGSLELNVQELKTISHYKLNIKTFVINNGGYVSMKKWQGNFKEIYLTQRN